MFEAHNLYADEFLPAQHNDATTPAEPKLPNAVHLLHAQYQCPLYIWFAQGKRKSRDGQLTPTVYIHVEYRRADGTPAWKLLQYAGTAVPEAIWQQLTELELPGLCPQQTRANPIGC